MKDYTGWTLFLDRDGVINRRLVGRYVRNWEAFDFIEGVIESLVRFNSVFEHIVVVTNQQGIGKGIMSELDLEQLHDKMCRAVRDSGGRIDRCYYCPKLAKENPPCRKPNTGMALQAQSDFPEIDFRKSVMVGDSLSDMEFGYRLKMHTVLITTKKEEAEMLASGRYDEMINERHPSLKAFGASVL